jgi:hypothetical protein
MVAAKMAHAAHAHSFRVIDRDGITGPLYEETLKFVSEFFQRSDRQLEP